MSRQLRTGTTPELLVRRELHRRGLRYRVNAPLPGLPRRRADLTFGRARVAVFIDGCFWHACPEHATWPARNGGWWAAKLRSNVARDRNTDAVLNAIGWLPVRIWEHEDAVTAADTIQEVVQQRLEAK